MQISDLQFIAEKLQDGAIGILPTDTIYGVVGVAGLPETIDRIYEAKGREDHKPFVILISEITQLEGLAISLSEAQIEKLQELWQEPVSVILACEAEELNYLHRGKKTLAIRIPNQVWLKELIHVTGPIVATSANISGQPVANSYEEIMQQLPNLDFYIEGATGNTPSKLAILKDNGDVEWLQRG